VTRNATPPTPSTPPALAAGDASTLLDRLIYEQVVACIDLEELHALEQAIALLATELDDVGLEPAPGWPAGIYRFGAEVLRVGIVVASELPRDATTLLVRLMAAGPLLAQAVNELAALPKDAHERAVAEPVLLAFQHALERNPSRPPDEQEFIVAMYKTWEEGRAEARIEGRTEGRIEGRTEGQANAVLTVLRVRGIAVPDPARLRILAQTDPARLERWLEQAITATSVTDLIDDPT